MARVWPALLVLSACTPGDPRNEHAIVVVFVVDTLGKAMADTTDWCGRMTSITGDFGLDVSCLEGAVAPSSWTGESHSRFLWPQNTVGTKRANQQPDCGDPSVLQSIRDASGGTYIWGADNGMLSRSGKEVCSLFRTQFPQGSDVLWETTLHDYELPDVPEAERPVHHAIDDFSFEVGFSDRPVELFLNALEPGGHEPRCWATPTSEACEALWQVAVSAKLVEADADRRAAWTDSAFYLSFLQLTSVRHADEEARWRPLWWQVTQDKVEAFREEMFDERLRRVLDAVKSADRLDDLRLVVLGDHGENPCVKRVGEDTALNCGHNGVPTEYTAYVPVYISPPALADDWREQGFVGDAATPWSTVNLAHGLLEHLGVAKPTTWGEMEPVGTATSWTCLTPEEGRVSGLHVEGEVSVRCVGDDCEVSDFRLPTDETLVPTPVADPPEWVAEWTGSPTWFTEACGVE